MMPQNVSFLERAIRKLANSNVGYNEESII